MSPILLTGLAALLVMTPKPAMAQCDPYDAFCNLGISNAPVRTSNFSAVRRAAPNPSIAPAQCPSGTRLNSDGSCLVVSSSVMTGGFTTPRPIVDNRFARPVQSAPLAPCPQGTRLDNDGRCLIVSPSPRPQSVMSHPLSVNHAVHDNQVSSQVSMSASEYQTCPEGTVPQPDNSCHVQKTEPQTNMAKPSDQGPRMSGQPVYNLDGTMAGTVIIMTDPTGAVSVPGSDHSFDEPSDLVSLNDSGF